MRLSPRPTAILRFVALLIVAQPVHAQITSSLDFGTRVDRTGGPAADWRGAFIVAPAVRFDHRALAFDASGHVLGSNGGRLTGNAIGTATLFSPARAGFRAALTAEGARSELDDSLPLARGSMGARLSYLRRSWGLWAGRDAAIDNRSTPLPIVPDVTFGGGANSGGAVITLSVGSTQARTGAHPRSFRTVKDSLGNDRIVGDSGSAGTVHAWTDAEAGMYWARGRLALAGAFGARLQTRAERGGTSGNLETTLALSPHAAMVAAAGVRPRSVAYGMSPARYVNLGLRLAPSALLRPRLPVGVRPSAAAFALRGAGAGRYVVRVRVPNARTVELSGDFSRWTPITLSRAADATDMWEATIAIPGGTHHVAIRVDGDKWTAPPGTSVVDDEFGGRVGVVVVTP